jgi:hypothetical protein
MYEAASKLPKTRISCRSVVGFGGFVWNFTTP